MGKLDQYNFDTLVNEAERLVVEEMERQLQDSVDVCTCMDTTGQLRAIRRVSAGKLHKTLHLYRRISRPDRKLGAEGQ